MSPPAKRMSDHALYQRLKKLDPATFEQFCFTSSKSAIAARIPDL